MNNKKTIYLAIILVVVLVLGLVWTFWGRNADENISKNGEVIDMRVERPNFVIETKNVAELEVFALPFGTEITIENAISLGGPSYVSENDGVQTWNLALPEEPRLFSSIFLRGADRQDVPIKDFYMKETGAKEIYNLHWGDPTSKDEEINETAELKEGETKNVAGLSITLLAVSEDSRCPVGVVCVWAGRVAVQFEVNNGIKTSSLTMYSDDSKTLDFEGYKINFVSAKPSPVAGATLKQSDYSVVFGISF